MCWFSRGSKPSDHGEFPQSLRTRLEKPRISLASFYFCLHNQLPAPFATRR
jgi:hypothetical protein